MPPSSVRDLKAAVEAGDQAQVRVLLHARPELVHTDMSASDEHRALHFAVLRRDESMVRLLMQAGADARKGIYPHRDATSGFTIARDREYLEIAAIIEEEEQQRRAELSCPNSTITPTQESISRCIAEHRNAEAVRLLDADRSLIHACDRGGASPLHIAASAFNVEMVSWLLDWRADVHKQDLRGLTALDRAAVAAHPSNSGAAQFPAIAKMLLNYDARMTLRAAVALGDTRNVRDFLQSDPRALREVSAGGGLLTIAVNHGQAKTAALLLDLGADVDERFMLHELEQPTESWGAPLWHAALAGNAPMVELLLDRGADANANVYASGWPLRNAWHHQDETVKLMLLARGAQLQPYMVAETHNVAEARRMLATDSSEGLGRELAISAADHGCPAILRLALERLSWPHNDPRWHWVLIQPMRGATGDASSGHEECLKLLLQYGIEPNISRFGQTPLHFTAGRRGEITEEQRARFTAVLLDYGARFDLRDHLLESTPLGWACRWGRTEMVGLLLSRGAPAREPDAKPWATPEAWARKMDHPDVLDLLAKRIT